MEMERKAWKEMGTGTGGKETERIYANLVGNIVNSHAKRCGREFISFRC